LLRWFKGYWLGSNTKSCGKVAVGHHAPNTYRAIYATDASWHPASIIFYFPAKMNASFQERGQSSSEAWALSWLRYRLV